MKATMVQITPNAEGNRRLPTLQALRGIAASLVVLHHYARLYQQTQIRPSWINNSGLGDLGKCGVDLFFVISGFIMVYTTRRKTGVEDALRFLMRRAFRIYPLYWFWSSVLLFLWAGRWALLQEHYTTSYLVKSYLLIPSFNGHNYQPLIRQGWTLSYEVLFYLAFSCAMPLKAKVSQLVFVSAVLTALFLIGQVVMPTNGAKYLLSNPIMFEFLYGIVAAELLFVAQNRYGKETRKLSGITLIVLGSVALLSTVVVKNAEPLRFVFYGFPAFFVVFGAAVIESAQVPRALVYLGDCSFSIYITHEFFLLVYGSAIKHVPAIRKIPSDTAILLATLITIVLCSFTYRLVEKPMTRAFSRQWPKVNSKVSAETSVAS